MLALLRLTRYLLLDSFYSFGMMLNLTLYIYIYILATYNINYTLSIFMKTNVLSQIHPLNNNYDSDEIDPPVLDNKYELNHSSESDNQNSNFPKEKKENSKKSPTSSNKCIWILSLLIMIQSVAMGLGGYYLFTENDKKTERSDKLEENLESRRSLLGEQNDKVNTELGTLNNSTEKIEDFIKNGVDSKISVSLKGYVNKVGIFGVQLEWSSEGSIAISEANCSLTGSCMEEEIQNHGKKYILNLVSDQEYIYIYIYN